MAFPPFKILLPVATTSVVLGSALANQAIPHPIQETGVTCEIAVEQTQYGNRYAGQITATQAVAGDYTLTINKRGANGRAMLTQGGAFTVAAGETQTLGQATFGGLPPKAVIAEMTLTWDGHSLSCDNDIDI